MFFSMDSDLCNALDNPERLQTLAVNVKYANGNSLLHQFVLDNSDPNNPRSESYITALLRSMQSMSGFKVNICNIHGYSALHLAVLKNNILMVKKLLSCLPNIDVNKRCSFNKKNTALHFAAQFSHLTIIEELLDKGVCVNAENRDGGTALGIAAKSGDSDAMEILGARVGVPLHYAERSGNLGMVEFLVNNGADVNAKNERGQTPLCGAVRSGNLAIVKFLVRNGADVSAGDYSDKTSLHYAAGSGNLDIVEFLMCNGGDLKSGDVFKRTPIHYAAQSRKLAVVKFMVCNGGDISARDIYDSTPLHYAARTYNLAILEFLVSNGADVNAKDWEDEIPLHRAATIENVKFLISKGSDVNAKNKRGMTPLDRAKKTENQLHIRLFIDALESATNV